MAPATPTIKIPKFYPLPENNSDFLLLIAFASAANCKVF